MGGRALIALGGNALCGADQTGTYAEQRENARAMAASIGELIDAGWQVVVVHGNGPQVGALGVQQEAAATHVPRAAAVLALRHDAGLPGQPHRAWPSTSVSGPAARW